MDLQISVFLLLILFTAGHSHMCYECLTNPCIEKLVYCPSGISKCLSKTMEVQIDYITSSHTTKGCAARCEIGSMNLYFAKLSTSCCGGYFCNANNAPDPRTLIPNGKMCYTCDGLSCSKIMRCSGNEDRCITATETSGSTVVKGCISEVFCDAIQSAELEDMSCCEGNLCNSEERVIQRFKHNRNESGIKSVTESVIQSVTQSSMIDRDEAVTHNYIYDSYESDADESVTQGFKYDGDKRVFQGFRYNAAPSVAQSVLFLCCSLLSFILIT